MNEIDVKTAYQTLQIELHNSRDAIKAEQKLIRESTRNRKVIRKTTLIHEIHELLASGAIDLTDREREMFTKISFTSNLDAPIKLKSRPKRLKRMKKLNTKKFLENLATLRVCSASKSAPPQPPQGVPPRNCPQPILKSYRPDHFHYIAGLNISEMIDSLHISARPVVMSSTPETTSQSSASHS